MTSKSARRRASHERRLERREFEKRALGRAEADAIGEDMAREEAELDAAMEIVEA
jgi:hypothetical protein